MIHVTTPRLSVPEPPHHVLGGQHWVHSTRLAPGSAQEADAEVPCLLVSALPARLGWGQGGSPKSRKESRALLGVCRQQLVPR